MRVIHECNFLFQIDDKHTTLDISGGEKWKTLRKSLSPTFSTGKIKGMMEPMAGVADDMLDFIDDKVKNSKNGEINVKEVFQGKIQYTTQTEILKKCETFVCRIREITNLFFFRSCHQHNLPLCFWN